METNNENLLISKKELEQYKVILEDWISEDASIAIALNNSYISYFPSTHHIHLKIGEKLHPESVASRVLKSRTKIDAIVDETILGTPYYAIGYPIIINKQEGALVIVLPSTYLPKQHEPYKFLTGKVDEDWTPIPTSDISHIESLQKRTWFYANDEQYKTNLTLKELQTKLPEYFLRVHRSYIVNIYFIKRIFRDLSSNFVLELKTGSELPVSNTYINDLRKVLEF